MTPPILPTSFEKIVSTWGKIVKFKESSCVFYYSKADFLRRFAQLQQDRQIYQKYFGNREIKLIDAEAVVLEEQEDWETILSLNSHQKTVPIFFIIGLDQILRDKNARVLNFLQEKEAENPEVSYLLFFTTDFTHPDFWPIVSGRSVFIQNVIIYPMHSLEDASQFVTYLCEKWGMQIKPQIKNEILKQCGSHFWLIKEAVRFLRDLPNAPVNEIFFHEQMMWRVKSIWEKFLPSEKNAMLKLIKNEKDFLPEEKHSQKFLESVGYLNHGKITMPLLIEYINREILTARMTIDKTGRVLINGVCVSDSLSKSFKKILEVLNDHKNQIVSREEIAKTVWGKDWEERYSEWAIDQMISRLRKRLFRFGVGSTMIQTVKSKGVRLFG